MRLAKRGGRREELDEILAEIEPAEILDYEGVDYRVTNGNSGTQLNIRECPRCGGSSWKVYLNEETGLGNCFHGACVGERGYTLFTFVQHLNGMTPRETVHYLKSYLNGRGWRPKTKRAPKAAPETPADISVPSSIALGTNNELAYLKKRGFAGAWQARYQWRYCASGSFDYLDPKTGESKQQRYDGRVIIPVHDFDGKLVTFQGRDTTGGADRKYLFPPGLPGTGRFLYNAHRVRKKVSVILGEGALDVAAIELAIAKAKILDRVGAVGSFGKSLSGSPSRSGQDQYSQLMELKRLGMKELVFMWDGERKTIAAACKEIGRLGFLGVRLRLAILPPNKDPNEVGWREVIKAYKEALVCDRGSLMKLRMKLAFGES